MNKVYANTWATNIGRSPRFDDKTYRRPTLQCKIAVTLKERAKSASNIIGRARNTSTKQSIDTRELVTGVQLHRLRSVEDNTEATCGLKSNDMFQKLEPCNIKQRNDIRESQRKKLMNGRPKTAFARYNFKKHNASNEHVEFVEKSLKVMSISKHISTHKHKLDETPDDKPTDDNACNDRQANRKFRAKSAPPCVITSSSEQYGRKRQSFHLPLFWRTRKSYHRKQQNLETEVGNFNGDGNKGTQLRSLLQNKQTKCQQSCPYQCKSCFRACLASDKYMQRQLDRKESSIKE